MEDKAQSQENGHKDVDLKVIQKIEFDRLS